ncbi:hypothetical protein DFJ58DRAFT_837159 [Suillus subalutaceus]|uniref:uncharacterized protein n=1 Tax=Suillus subalutaceus TaxID=48586 RepID=UPI001B878092|nr:uncharacterized protein DFJ58DRAFT_837159 [Suillus subalutaceus]KAG1871854.1 hypothetical protein DFJ58DRAFT_837159 [Suillus subalutaceus]
MWNCDSEFVGSELCWLILGQTIIIVAIDSPCTPAASRAREAPLPPHQLDIPFVYTRPLINAKWSDFAIDSLAEEMGEGCAGKISVDEQQGFQHSSENAAVIIAGC